MGSPIYNPGQPYITAIPGGFSPGKISHLTGRFSPTATSLVMKFQSGPYGDPTDEIGLCIYARLHERVLGMNAFTRATGWSLEQVVSNQGFVGGQPFELTILSDPYQFKIAVNHQHMGEFAHQLNPASLTYFNVASGSNDITIDCIWVEDPSVGQPVQPPGQGAPYPPPPIGQQTYLPQNSSIPPSSSGMKGSKGLLGMVGSASAALTGALSNSSSLFGKSKGYHNPGGYPGAQPQYGGYPGAQPQYGGYPGGQPQHGGYPGAHYGGYPQSGHKSGSGGILNKALAVGGGILGAKAVSKGMGGMQSKGMGGLGGLGGSKAMKYGIPLAGAGLGGYMLSKGIGESFSFDGSDSD